MRYIILLFLLTISFNGIAQIDTIFFASGEIKEIGQFHKSQKNGAWKSYFLNGKVKSEGYYKKGKMSGQSTWFHENGTKKSIENWKKDRFKDGIFWDSLGNKSTIDEILVKPKYPNGLDGFRQMVADNLKYPDIAAENGIEGEVLMQFVINKDGELVDLICKRSIHPDLDKEAYRVLKLSENWEPGHIHNRKVRVQFAFPVVFQLE